MIDNTTEFLNQVKTCATPKQIQNLNRGTSLLQWDAQKA